MCSVTIYLLRQKHQCSNLKVGLWSLITLYHFPGKGLVAMADVEAAIQEMFQAPHIQVS